MLVIEITIMMTKMKRKKNDVGDENKLNNNNDETAVRCQVANEKRIT